MTDSPNTYEPPALIYNPLKPTAHGRCRYCRCTDDHACPEGCSWADIQHTVCDSTECLHRWARALAMALMKVPNSVRPRDVKG